MQVGRLVLTNGSPQQVDTITLDSGSVMTHASHLIPVCGHQERNVMVAIAFKSFLLVWTCTTPVQCILQTRSHLLGA